MAHFLYTEHTLLQTGTVSLLQHLQTHFNPAGQQQLIGERFNIFSYK